MKASPSQLTLPPAWATLTLVSVLLLEAGLVLSVATASSPAVRASSVHPDLALVNRLHVAIASPVSVRFDRAVDTTRVFVHVDPPTPFQTARLPDQIVITPEPSWAPEQTYTISLGPLRSSDQRALLGGWTSSFVTQPRLSVSGFKVDGRAAGQLAPVAPGTRLEVLFPQGMRPESLQLTSGGQPVDDGQLEWSGDRTTVSLVPGGLTPYQPLDVSVAAGAVTVGGDVLTDGGSIRLLGVAVLPANSFSGIGAGFQTQAPIQIAIDNAGPARPQSGFQKADIIYEYLSEYTISRMTAIYFNSLPAQVGPIRSCRMVNPYLDFAFSGLTMCSGASVGTLHYMFGNGDGAPLVPGSINDFDRGGHFFRVGFKPAPHNVYTSADDAYRLRTEWPLTPGQYLVDPPHDDVEMGIPADPPAVGLHGATYAYDGGSRQYLRFQFGAPHVDADTGHRLAIKNIVILHVPFRDAGWIEDEAGGAHSIWYDLLGSGPAEVYSDGRLIQATWHMGSAPGQNYYDNHTPVWFSDSAGQVLRLNTGLTWIHVLGNGQTS